MYSMKVSRVSYPDWLEDLTQQNLHLGLKNMLLDQDQAQESEA